MRLLNLMRIAGASFALLSALLFGGTGLAQGQNATLIVEHNTTPDDPTLFSYAVSGPTSGGSGLDDDPATAFPIATKSFGVVAGDYEITQSSPGAGWLLDSVNCQGATSQVPDIAKRKIALNVAIGSTVTCRFNNRRETGPPTGRIVIRKLVPGKPNQPFNFGISGNGFSDTFSLDDFGPPTGAPLPERQKAFDLSPGQYLVNEVPTPGWVLTQINCPPNAPPFDPNAIRDVTKGQVTINLAAGQVVQCNFVNQRAATIIIKKLASPPDSQIFTFAASGGNGANPTFLSGTFDLDDDGGSSNPLSNSQTFSVPPGSYSFTEGLISGWDLTTIDCQPSSAPNVTKDVLNRKVTIGIAAGQTVICTFRNKKQPKPCPPGYNMNEVVTFTPGPNPNPVHICRGGTVTFKNLGALATMNIVPVSPGGSFSPLTLGGSGTSATTTPFPNPGTYTYSWAAMGTPATIIVH